MKNVAFAQTPTANDINQRLKAYHDANQCDQGFDYANEHLLAMEGDAAFDFYYGLCALSVQKYPEARFAFERLVALYPEQGRFRLEFGRALYGLKQYEQANEQFNLVLAQEPPQGVKENIQAFIGAMDRQQQQSQKTWTGALGFSFGSDTNINNATELETFSGVTLNPASRSIDSAYYSALSSLNYEKNLNQRYRTGLRFSSQHKYNTEVSDYDFDTVSVQNYLARKHAGGELQLGASFLLIRVNGEAYEDDVGFSSSWRQNLGWNIQSQLTVSFTSKEFDTYVEQASDQTALSLVVLRPGKTSLHSLFLNYSTDSAKETGLDDRMRDTLRLKYRYTQLVKKQWELFGEAGLTLTDYQAEHPLFGEVRSDETAQLTFGTKWRMTKNWSTQFEASYTTNQSNLILFEYDRFYTKFQVLWGF